ncbi:MAG: ATP--guanido phosphotransferase, partial [Eubacteriales bacterium]
MAWYHVPGNEQDVVISTRVRFARNLSEYPFPSRLDATGAKEIINKVGQVLEDNGFTKTDFSDISHTAAVSL